MSVKNYYSFGGEILAEETGGVRRDYLTDAHGSVTATVTSVGVIENTYRYKPYGETLAKTGAGSDPNFLWSGTWGYRSGGATSTFYVRARTYHQGTARWTSLDPIRHGYNWYAYCQSDPVGFIDPLGLDELDDAREYFRQKIYPNVEAAALDMDCHLYPISRDRLHEIGGGIYKIPNVGFFVGDIQESRPGSSGSVRYPNQSTNFDGNDMYLDGSDVYYNISGGYHTHPFYENEVINPSRPDIVAANPWLASGPDRDQTGLFNQYFPGFIEYIGHSGGLGSWQVGGDRRGKLQAIYDRPRKSIRPKKQKNNEKE